MYGSNNQLIIINDTKLFIVNFKQRCKDIYTQTCFSEIEKSNRCRLYRDIKEVHDTEFYLRQQYNCHLRQGLSKIILSSHKFFVERGRWSKSKVEYIDRLFTLCDQRDIKDELHILIRVHTALSSQKVITFYDYFC